MLRSTLAIVAVALVAAAPAAGEIRIARDLPVDSYAARGAVGLYVPGDLHGRSLAFELIRRVENSEVAPLPTGGRGIERIRIGAAGPPVVWLEEPEPGRSGERGRYAIAVVGAGFHGVLLSDSTRLDGLVTLDDVVGGRLESRADDDAAATVERLDDRIARNDELRLPLTIVVVAATILAAILRPRLAPRVVLVALALNLWLSPALALAAGLAAVALPLGPACLAVIAVYLAALGLDAETVALSPLGPSQVSRFYGVNNLVETLLLLPALLGAALLGRLGVVVAGAALVAVAGNRFGADGGGLVVLLAGYGVLAWRLTGRRLTWPTAAALGGGVALAGLALVGVDALTGGSSHVTRALGDGPGALAGDLGDRLERSVERTWDAKGALVVVLVGLAVLAWALRRRGDPVLDALLAALAVSLLVNDTPSDVVAAGAAAAVALVRLKEGIGDAATDVWPRHPLVRSRPYAPLRPARLARGRRARARRGGLRGRRGGDADAEHGRRNVVAGDDHRGDDDGRRRDGRGERRGGQAGIRQRGLRRLPHARRRGHERQRRPEPRRREARRLARDGARHERPGRDAVVQGSAVGEADRRRGRVRLVGRRFLIRLPDDFPRDAEALACDLDRTLIDEDGELRPRTIGALRDARAAGLHVTIVTGRMFRSVRPYLELAGLDEPVVCYQGAAVVEPTSGRFVRHVPIELDLAREAIAAVQERGFSLNCYVDDDLYVAAETPGARAYADFQHIPLNVVGPLLPWLDRPPTKLVVVDDPDTLDALKPELVGAFDGRLFIAKSLPYFLELASPEVSKGSGMAFLAELLGFAAERTVAFGDGENDLELLEWAGYAVAVENGDARLKARADWLVPGPKDEGVAQAIEAYLARSSP